LACVADVVDDAAVSPQVVGNVLDGVAVAMQRIGVVDRLVVQPVVDDLPPARSLGSRGRRADAQRKSGERGEEEAGGDGTNGTDGLSLSAR
jgi:hypothetical protein